MKMYTSLFRTFWGRSKPAMVLVAIAFAILGFVSGSSAQETPRTTPAATPEADSTTVLRVDFDTSSEPFEEGSIIEAQVIVEDVEHLAGFDFTLQFPPDSLELVTDELDSVTPAFDADNEASPQVKDVGALLAESERGEGLRCSSPVSGEGRVTVSCSTLGPPVCAGGSPGASGSGILGIVPFRPLRDGVVEIGFASGTLVLDDLVPCNDEGLAQAIPHEKVGTTIEIAGTDGDFPWPIAGLAGGGVAIVVVGAALSYYWYRLRH